MGRALVAALLLLAASLGTAGAATISRAVLIVASTDKGGPSMTDAVEMVRGRIELVSGIQPTVRALPDRHIQIDLAGDASFETLQKLFGPGEQLTLHRVPENLTPDDVRAGRGGPDVMLLKFAYEPKKWLPVYKKSLPFGRVIDATNAVDQLSNLPMVAIQLDETGKNAFGQITRENFGHQIAIVLGAKVLISPVVLSPILGGQLHIQGNLSQQQASDLAERILAASLPSPFKLVELRKIKSTK